jgi:hypothetical protein
VWNLYPEYDFRTEAGRVQFLSDQAGTRIRRLGLRQLDYLALGISLVGQLALAGASLRRQEKV